MTFNSLQFFVFFAVVLVAYHRLGVKGQNRLVVVAGSVFYAAFDWRFLGLLYLSIAIDYSVGRALAASDDPRRRKLLLTVSLVGQLGILGAFKYANFFADSVERLLGTFGFGADWFTLEVVLPVGISFYTFQTLAYVFAVYRRQLDAERDLVTFAAFVAWFPQMAAGPIERATSLLPQIRRHRERPSGPLAESAVLLILRGLVKKVVIADGVAVYVNEVYAAPGRFGWSALVLATVGFGVQAYGDFSGYTDIARGTSRLLGVELRRNFEQPFLARDMREFWQRWHTSLGWWFAEFVAPALGGARKGRTRAALNVIILFALIGLWHGAAWTFVLWGLYNGVLVAARRYRKDPVKRHPMKLRLVDVPAIVLTFALFCGGLVLFRSASVGQAREVAQRIVTLAGGASPVSSALLVLVMLAAVVAFDLVERRRRVATIERLRVKMNLGGVPNPEEAAAESYLVNAGVLAAGVTIGAMLVALVVYSGGTPTPFIYFQF